MRCLESLWENSVGEAAGSPMVTALLSVSLAGRYQCSQRQPAGPDVTLRPHLIASKQPGECHLMDDSLGDSTPAVPRGVSSIR